MPAPSADTASVKLSSSPNSQKVMAHSQRRKFIAAIAKGITAITTLSADTALPGKWVMGHGWEEAHWDGQLPSAEWIDVISPHNPVLLYRMDGHMVQLNSMALQLAGIDADTAAPAGGRIDHSKSGKPTGILVYVSVAYIMFACNKLKQGQKPISQSPINHRMLLS